MAGEIIADASPPKGSRRTSLRASASISNVLPSPSRPTRAGARQSTSRAEQSPRKPVAIQKRKRVETPSPAPSSDDSDKEYEVDYIVDARIVKKRRVPKLEYLVHWTDYPVDERTWEPEENVGDQDSILVKAFYRKNPFKPRLQRAASPTSEAPAEEADSESIVDHGESVEPDGGLIEAALHLPPKEEKFPFKQKASPISVKHSPSFADRKESLVTAEVVEEAMSSNKRPARASARKSAPIYVDDESDGPESPKSPPKRTTRGPTKKNDAASSKQPPKKKRRVNDDDESDFVMDEGVDEDEGDDDVIFSDEQEQEHGQESADEAEDAEESEEEIKTSKTSKARASLSKAKAKPRKSAAMANFDTGVIPLGQNIDIKLAVKDMSEDLPPMSNVEAMFDHLVSRMPDIVQLVKQLNGRKLRVATMCSGTESPLLALDMIAQAIKSQHDLTLSFDHVFSCEIEPFKQAYIERNFAPPILFRDVTELGKKSAHTAYGSLVEIPGDVDILIAGTSCVDYSNLNNVQQDIDANGESGRTFRGMLQWVNKHKPPIVILENVCSAPWAKVVEYFAEIDYDADFTRLDTKEFYIPHTRTRVYLFATPSTKSGDLPEQWQQTVKDLRRPWSSPFEAFLLHTDDPNIHRARLDLASAKAQSEGTSRKPTDWTRCESRHHRAREEEELGLQRPLTSWQEAGVCKGLDWTWNDWLLTQTERVVDLLEISTLRMAKDGVDSGHKACIWNVSQNVDRQTGSAKTALAPCLTPNMIPWVTIRGGPVTGREALALQGIPVRELLLTSETEDQLADLAGNAMSTTVVGSAMLSALRVACHRLKAGTNPDQDATSLIQEAAVIDEQIAGRIVGEERLERHDLDLAKVAGSNLGILLDLAHRSSRHCQCEGQSGTVDNILECVECHYRACKSCGGRPEHVYSNCANLRVQPVEFEKRLKDLLPMRVEIAGLGTESLAKAKTKAQERAKTLVDEGDWRLWSDAVLEAVTGAEFRFRHLKRQGVWTAVYEAPGASLSLVLDKQMPEWRLTIQSPASEPNDSRLRALLLHPVARLQIDTTGQDVLCGPWNLCIPSRSTIDVTIIGRGDKVPSWEASLGLQGTFAGKERWSELEVQVDSAGEEILDRKISGIYKLLPNCGQAMASLHKRVLSSEDKLLPQLYFFFDPTRCGDSSDDSYVFSTSTDRLDYGTERPVIAQLRSSWRENDEDSQASSVRASGSWVTCEEAHLAAMGGGDIAVVGATTDSVIDRDVATFAVPKSASSISVSLDNDACTHASAILSCRVPLNPSHSESMWRNGAWGEVDLSHQGNAAFANLAWITERLPPMNALEQWTVIANSRSAEDVCKRCAPRPPRVHWIKKAGKVNKRGAKTKSTIIAYEDRYEAGRYEHALKSRPSPFVLQLRLDDGFGSFRIGLNVVSLAHRALSRLPHDGLKGKTNLSWRLTPGPIAENPRPPKVFVIPSNKRDPQHAQPAGFKFRLRTEQLRSVWWMLAQEEAAGKTHTFVEEEIAEAILPAVGWRAEGKAERPVLVRGGVIADQVGYGKTVITIALIAETREAPAPEPAPVDLIDLKATLILVPGHLSKQWPSEIARFTGDMFEVMVIQNMRDLQGKTIAELSKADIIVMATEIFEADLYWERFEYLAAHPEGWLNDPQGGRFFSDRLDSALATLRSQTRVLKEEGAGEAIKTMAKIQEDARGEVEGGAEVHKSIKFGKRMKGRAYRDRYDGEAKKKTTLAEMENWEASDDDDDDDDELADIPMPTFRQAKGSEAFTSSAVKQDFNKLSCPVMHMFRFRRVVADEFTYLQKKSLPAILRLTSSYKWILSGTPPVDDFAAIRSIASFMGLHLGMEDDGEASTQYLKIRAKEQTQAEKFHAFREVHSQVWHQHRDDLAQTFLDKFVRQNIAEIEEIPTVEHIHTFMLPASEGAVYLELEHHLQALEMRTRKETKYKNVSQGDRHARLEEALSDSKTAEEALLKRCCHFTLDLNDKTRDVESAREACQHISGARALQLTACQADLAVSVNQAVTFHTWIKKKGYFTKSDPSPQPFTQWVTSSWDTRKHQGDAEAARRVTKVLEKECNIKDAVIPSSPAGKTNAVPKGAKVDDVKWQLREQTHLLRKLSKELVGRVRSLRFFEVIRKLQQGGEEALEVLETSGCEHKPSTAASAAMAILSCCGHVACHECLVKAANSQRCIESEKCTAPVRQTNIVKVSTLGVEGQLSSGRYGAKLAKLVDLIHTIPEDERVLVFLQWEDLASKVSEALTTGGIPHHTLTGAVKARANTLDRFQSSDASSSRVLLLKMNDASAAGSNLTTANHAIFLGPLFTPSLYNYRAVETQAIGRVRRYGQQKEVHVHRLLALDTIDMTISNSRRAELKEKTDWEELPQAEYTGQPSGAVPNNADIPNAVPKREQGKRASLSEITTNGNKREADSESEKVSKRVVRGKRDAENGD
ncbi:hypothetical protein B9479_004420 [Cryptococcus floricola]|uniref:Chromo domain-containing protein n=1 Tax=Cryptococcus floricola TaxID=2591691 RepID=A0A5D3AVN7_9TREE|nr:hypothetical protein B9479_004420 [Cryptococcus floricola]